MNREDAVKLLRLVKGIRPQQPWDDMTPQGWAMSFQRYRIEDALKAVENLTSSTWITPPEIETEIKRIRDGRIEALGDDFPEFPGDPDDGRGYVAWRQAMVTAIADGATPEQAQRSELVQRVMPDLRRILPSPPPVTRDERAIDDRVVPYKSAPKPPTEVPQAKREALEAERQRQLKALQWAIDDAAEGGER